VCVGQYLLAAQFLSASVAVSCIRALSHVSCPCSNPSFCIVYRAYICKGQSVLGKRGEITSHVTAPTSAVSSRSCRAINPALAALYKPHFTVRKKIEESSAARFCTRGNPVRRRSGCGVIACWPRSCRLRCMRIREPRLPRFGHSSHSRVHRERMEST